MIRKFILPAISVLCFFIALWGGTWLMHIVPEWAGFAAFTTTFLCCTLCITAFIASCANAVTHIGDQE